MTRADESAPPYDALFHAITEAVAVWRPVYGRRGRLSDFVFETANDAFKQLFGVADPIDRKAKKLSPGLDERLPEVLEMCTRALAAGALERREYYFPLLGKWLSVKVWCLTEDRALAAFEDITERKSVQERLARLEYSLDRMEDYPTWNDAEGRIIEVSESTCRHLEYTREELLDLTVFDICHDIDSQDWLASSAPPEQTAIFTGRGRTGSHSWSDTADHQTWPRGL